MEINEFVKTARDLVIGDNFRIKPSGVLKKLDEDGKLYFGWNKEIPNTGEIYTVTQDILDNLNSDIPHLFKIENKNDPEEPYWIGSDMIDIIHGSGSGYRIPELIISEKDPKILKEMIDSVDKIRFKKLLALAANIAFQDVSNEIVDKYLDSWANAKYEFYVLFGKKLWLENTVETDLTEKEVSLRWATLQKKYPHAALLLNQFSTDSVMLNSCPHSSFLSDIFGDLYKQGMKLSKFIGSIYKDKNLNDEISTLMTTRTCDFKMRVSIDPYDYFTISYNKYGWTSCVGLTKHSAYLTQIAAIMLDETTTVGYACPPDDVEYIENKMKFSGNNKAWRQLIQIDKGSGALLFNREYHEHHEAFSSEMRRFLEDKISEYMGIENCWIKQKTVRGYEQGSKAMYHDAALQKDLVVSYRLENGIFEPNWQVGVNPYCVKCGSKIRSAKSALLCSNC